VTGLSTHAAELYRQSFDGSWALRLLARSPATSLPHCSFVFLQPSICFRPFGQPLYNGRLASTSVGSINPRRELSSRIDLSPAEHTSSGFSRRGAGIFKRFKYFHDHFVCNVCTG